MDVVWLARELARWLHLQVMLAKATVVGTVIVIVYRIIIKIILNLIGTALLSR